MMFILLALSFLPESVADGNGLLGHLRVVLYWLVQKVFEIVAEGLKTVNVKVIICLEFGYLEQ